MIPLAIPNMTGREQTYLNECIRTNMVSSVGPFVGRFEEMVARAAGAANAVATTSGTTALHAALTAVGVGQGDLVVIPSFTFIASANAVSHCGATPWLVDIDPSSWTIDPSCLDRALQNNTQMRSGTCIHLPTNRRVVAIMPVHTLGLPADMDKVLSIANRYKLPVVADAAAALGARYLGKSIAATDAEFTVFSFNGNKTVTCGGGGAICTNNSQLAAVVRHLTTTARRGTDYTHDMIGFNYRLTNVQAAIGCAQMESLDEFVRAKRQISAAYDQAFADLSYASAFPKPAWAEGACWFSGLHLHGLSASDVTKLQTALRESGIDARPFWKPVHLQQPYSDVPREELPTTEELWEHILTLPCSTSLTMAEQAQTIATTRALLRTIRPMDC
jgi:perosamine synthetase